MDTTTFAVYLKRSETESKKKVSLLADTQVIKRNNISECLYADQLKSRKKNKLTTNIALANQSGNINEKG
jgi:hypothetical protein